MANEVTQDRSQGIVEESVGCVHRWGERALWFYWQCLWWFSCQVRLSYPSLALQSLNFLSGGTITHYKRTDDNSTLGGNAYTGNSGDVDGGDVVNQGDNYGMPTMLNMNSNNAGSGGNSVAGCANGGHGNGRGSGGNAYSGSSGNAQGGSVFNSGAIMNIDSSAFYLIYGLDVLITVSTDNAGGAGLSQTGCANGGDVSDDPGTA